MPEISTKELYRYRAHRVNQDLYDFRSLLRSVGAEGVKLPIDLVTDGTHAVIEDGHKRVQAAMQHGIKSLPVRITQRQFSRNRRMKHPIGEELAQLLAPAPEPEPAAE